MVNVFSVWEALINDIKANHPNDIAIAAYYGSFAQGTATKRSDLDFFFIPATPDGYSVSIQFIVGDISFDFWPISWERAERMASFQEAQTTIIADSKLLYVRSEEDRARFMKLRETIDAMQAPQNARQLIERADSLLRDVYIHLYKMNRGSSDTQLTFLRTEAHAALSSVLQSPEPHLFYQRVR